MVSRERGLALRGMAGAAVFFRFLFFHGIKRKMNLILGQFVGGLGRGLEQKNKDGAAASDEEHIE